MNIIIKVPLVGDNFSLATGDVVTHYDPVEAKRWVDAGFAEDAGKAKAAFVLEPPQVIAPTPEPAAAEAKIVETATADDDLVEKR